MLIHGGVPVRNHANLQDSLTRGHAGGLSAENHVTSQVSHSDATNLVSAVAGNNSHKKIITF